jgi:hypothetical protein
MAMEQLWPRLGKWFVRPYLEKSPSQERAGIAAQGVGPEFIPHYCKIKPQKLNGIFKE